MVSGSKEMRFIHEHVILYISNLGLPKHEVVLLIRPKSYAKSIISSENIPFPSFFVLTELDFLIEIKSSAKFRGLILNSVTCSEISH